MRWTTTTFLPLNISATEDFCNLTFVWPQKMHNEKRDRPREQYQGVLKYKRLCLGLCLSQCHTRFILIVSYIGSAVLIMGVRNYSHICDIFQTSRSFNHCCSKHYNPVPASQISVRGEDEENICSFSELIESMWKLKIGLASSLIIIHTSKHILHK